MRKQGKIPGSWTCGITVGGGFRHSESGVPDASVLARQHGTPASSTALGFAEGSAEKTQSPRATAFESYLIGVEERPTRQKLPLIFATVQLNNKYASIPLGKVL